MDHIYEEDIRPMFHMMYERLLKDMKDGNTNSVIYRHHIDFVKENTAAYGYDVYLEGTSDEQMVVDFMASMTDDYFVDLFDYLFPHSNYHIDYISYFDL